MTQSELYHTLALMQVEGVGDVIAKKLIQHCGNAEAVFTSKKSQLQKIDGIGSVVIKNLQDKAVFVKAEAEIQFIAQENIFTTYFQEENYPERLKHCYDSPVLLFQAGNINLQNRRVISIVGTRQITSYGVEFTKKFLEEIAQLNPIIVSGFAYGVDIYAHQMAMDYGLQTIGVLAHGLNQIYPKTHKKYMAKMEQNGGFLTEFWSTSKPDKENFIKRNRIVAGISEATVVIESAEGWRPAGVVAIGVVVGSALAKVAQQPNQLRRVWPRIGERWQRIVDRRDRRRERFLSAGAERRGVLHQRSKVVVGARLADRQSEVRERWVGLSEQRLEVG